MSHRVWVPQDQIRATDLLLTDPLPEDPAELVEVERAETGPPAPPEEPAGSVITIDPAEYAAVRDLTLTLADLQPPAGKGSPTAAVHDAAARIRGGKP